MIKKSPVRRAFLCSKLDIKYLKIKQYQQLIFAIADIYETSSTYRYVVGDEIRLGIQIRKSYKISGLLLDKYSIIPHIYW